MPLSIMFLADDTSETGWVFNPFFSFSTAPSGSLAIYDSNGLLKASWFDFRHGSRHLLAQQDWVFMFPSASAGAQLSFTAGLVPGTLEVSSPLPPGNYRAQFIYYEAFVGIRSGEFVRYSPLDLGADPFGLSKKELFRSNSVEFALTA